MTAEQTWHFSNVHDCACLCLEEQTLWGQSVCRVWLANQDAVVRIPRSALRPLPEIRQHRLKRCDDDEAEWQREIAQAREIIPEIRPLLLMQVANMMAP